MHVIFTIAFSPCTDPDTSMQKDVRVGTRGKHSCNFQNKFFAHTGTTFTDLQPLKPANTHQEKKKTKHFHLGFLCLRISSLLFWFIFGSKIFTGIISNISTTVSFFVLNDVQ